MDTCDLNSVVLNAIRQQPGCEDVLSVGLQRLAEGGWSVSSVSPGEAPLDAVLTALQHIVPQLAQMA
jgi:hypothetical protein